MFLACENLAASETAPSEAAAHSPLNQKIASAFQRYTGERQRTHPDAPASDVAKILEFIAERDFSSGGQEGISFELATLVFGDDRCLVFQDRIDEAGEQRWHVLGNASLAPGLDATLLVVHSYREIFDGEGNYPHHLGPPS